MKIKKFNCNLSTCSMCRLCKEEWLPAIDSNRKTFLYKKGALLFKEGEAVKGMYFINEGLVKVHKKWDDEKDLILRFAKNGAIAGHRGLGSDTIYPASATALMDTRVCFVEIDFFISTLKVNTEYLFELMLFFAAELKESERKMRNLAHMPAKGRIALAIKSLQEKFGIDTDGFINISLSRQDLAAYTGTTYETLFRILNELAVEKIISITKSTIKIMDITKLLSFDVQH